jgi:hypothetical protein
VWCGYYTASYNREQRLGCLLSFSCRVPISVIYYRSSSGSPKMAAAGFVETSSPVIVHASTSRRTVVWSVILLCNPVVTICTTSLTFNNCTFCLHCIYLRTNSDLCHLQHKLIGFYNRDEKCLQRGTDWVFKRNSGWNVLTLRSGFDLGSVHVKFVVDRVALDRFFLSNLISPPCQYHSNQLSTLVFIQMLLLPVGQTSDAWGPSKIISFPKFV